MSRNQAPITALLTGLFVIPILATLSSSSTYANFMGACLMLAIAAATRFTAGQGQRSIEPRASGVAWGLAAAVLVVITGWLVQGIEFWTVPKTATYIAALLLFLSFSRAVVGDRELLTLLTKTKLAVLAGVSVFFLVYIYSVTVDSVFALKNHPPLFRHLRHLNYELYFGMILAAYGVLTAGKNKAASALLFLFVFLTIWSGGRGSVLAVLAALTYLVFFSRHLPVWRLSAMMLVFAIAATLVIFATGKQYMLMNTIDYSTEIVIDQPVGGSHQTRKRNQADARANPIAIDVGKFTAGRTGMWTDSFKTVASKGPQAIMTGLGPDAFQVHQIRPGFVHPHNSLMQAFMEFGLIGLCAFAVILAWFTARSIRICRVSRDPVHHLAAAMFVGGVMFSMVDGIFHHIGPLAMMVFTMALLHSIPAREAAATDA